MYRIEVPKVQVLLRFIRCLTVQWILSQCGLAGNEKPDLIAKKGATILRTG